jgi:hypothetical protein
MLPALVALCGRAIVGTGPRWIPIPDREIQKQTETPDTGDPEKFKKNREKRKNNRNCVNTRRG